MVRLLAFAYYTNDQILRALSGPLHGVKFELLVPYFVLLCILTTNRIITGYQLNVLSIVYSIMPVLIRKVVLGSKGFKREPTLQELDLLKGVQKFLL